MTAAIFVKTIILYERYARPWIRFNKANLLSLFPAWSAFLIYDSGKWSKAP
jgi:hypothetical protein